MKETIALFPANGIGDVVLMNVVACYSRHAGFDVHIYHPEHKSLAPLFPMLSFAPVPDKQALTSIIDSARYVFVQNDHSRQAYLLDKLREDKEHVIFIHPKHSPLQKPRDILFSLERPFATNLIENISPFFPGLTFDYEWLSEGLDKGVFRQDKKKVAIHPTSRDKARNWPMQKYLALKNRLKLQGFKPYFIVAKHEREAWEQCGLTDKELPLFDSLSSIANTLYSSGYFIGNDSGLGHIASMVGLPTLTISNYKKRVAMWRPDFSTSLIVTPPLLPNWKGVGFRFREQCWHHFVSVKKVEKTFEKLTKVCP